MAEARRGWRLPGLLAFLALLGMLTLVPGPAPAAIPARFRVAAKEPLPVPGAFRLPASNGYTLYVVGIPPRGGHPGSLLIYAAAKGKGVTYRTPAVVTETSIEADLGELGEISVAFQRSNHATSARCGKEVVRFDSGSYEGRIVFHGEGGYTTAEASSVPGNIDYWIESLCGESFLEVSSSRARGAALYVQNPALGQEMAVRKRRPGAAARITAWMSEYAEGTSIERFATSLIPGADFTYDRRLKTATVRPQSPFAGSARFDLGKKAGRRWSGDLTVDLPGRADVPLTGPLLRAFLVPVE